MQISDCLVPKYNVGDVVEFDRSNQDDGLFAKEGKLKGEITEITVIYTKEERCKVCGKTKRDLNGRPHPHTPSLPHHTPT